MKRVIKLIIVLSLVVFLFTSVAYAVGGEQIVWKYHMVEIEGAPLTNAVQEYICDPIFEKTNGGLKLVIYPAAVLGGERDVMQSLQLGSVEAMCHTAAIIGLFVPEFSFLNLPFLFNDEEHFYRFLHSASFRKLARKTEEYGFYLIGGGPLGYRLPTIRSKLIEKPADFQGLKMRTMEQPIHIATMKALGANPTSMPFPEIYNALRTKVVDGQYNDALAFRNLSIYEVTPYLTDLPFFISVEFTSISKVAFDKLPKDYQEIVREVFEENFEKAIRIGYKDNLEVLKETIVTGFKYYHRVDNLDPFRKAVNSVYDDFLKDYPEAKEYVDGVKAAE